MMVLEIHLLKSMNFIFKNVIGANLDICRSVNNNIKSYVHVEVSKEVWSHVKT